MASLKVSTMTSRPLLALSLFALWGCPDSDGVGEPVDAGVLEAVCGNGEVEGDEACDDGNENDGDSCLNSCLEARCGDGVLLEGTEACDDGNDDDTDDCLNSCVLASCGDGLVSENEACDDANTD
ncbi:MAG TPA: DUF4215 domain-containing protein, partial [Planctomycetes bacterium]|nr:DUF4215 domain-containing protein [Planctomycetota bacterium]